MNKKINKITMQKLLIVTRIKFNFTAATIVAILLLLGLFSINSNIAYASSSQTILSASTASTASITTDILFEHPSTDFNSDLAKFSLELSSASYGDTCKSIEKVLSGYGFTNDASYDNDSYEKASQFGTNLVGYSFAHKKIQCGRKDYTLIAVVIRGTNGDNEWISNFNINDSGNSPAIHEGFGKAEKALLSNLNSYVKSLNLNSSNTKFLITGHSRGAAVANLLVANLSKSEKLANQSNIYGYTFGTPNVAKVGNNNYFNIFNAVNPSDIVTEIPLAKWGYGKYGINYSLPDDSHINAENLAAAQKTLAQLTTMAPTVKDFYNAKLSLLLLKGNILSTGATSAHAPQVYMKHLNEVDSQKLTELVFELQLKLIPNANYAYVQFFT